MSKSLFTIDPSEKQRILEMHQSATRKQYLGEQVAPTTTTPATAPSPAPTPVKLTPISVKIPFEKIDNQKGQIIESTLTMNLKPSGSSFVGNDLTILFEPGVFVKFYIKNNEIGDSESAKQYSDIVNGEPTKYVQVGQYSGSANKKRTITYVNELIVSVNKQYSLNLTLNPNVSQVITQTSTSNTKTESTINVGTKKDVVISIRQSYDVESNTPIGNKSIGVSIPGKGSVSFSTFMKTPEKVAESAVYYLAKNGKIAKQPNPEFDKTYNEILSKIK
jgi:hypothetical protein